MFVAHSAERLEVLRRGVELQREAGVPSRLVTPAELEERVPGLVVEGLAGGAVCEEDGYFDRPQAVVEALGERARTLGARIERRAVRSIRRDGAGFRLELADGALSAERVVLAAGADSAGLAAGRRRPADRGRARHIFL